MKLNNKTFKPNVVLASFPRSGNTFLRNVLYEVYGIYSWNSIDLFIKNVDKFTELDVRKKNKGKLGKHGEMKLSELNHKLNYQVIKSHELPSKTLKMCAKDTSVIYLVRDGRDALVSMAYHRKDIVEPGTNFEKNLKAAIKAPFGSYFGGWSRNVKEWSKIADIVIKFEDFIIDPLKYTETFRSLIKMPAPIAEKIPTFESQRNGEAHFGGNERQRYSDKEKTEFNEKFFRKGKIGGWKQEMPEKLQALFWKKHGSVMEELGYARNEYSTSK